MYTNIRYSIQDIEYKIFKIHIYPRKFNWWILMFTCPKWDFEQFDEKPTKFRKLQTIKNTNEHSTKICIGLIINQYSLWINVNY